MRTKAGWIVLVLLIGGCAGVFAYRHADVRRERAEVARRQRDHQELIRLRADNEHLRAAQLSATERQGLLAMREAAAAARREISALQSQVAAIEPMAVDRSPSSQPRFSVDVAMPASEWKNVGAATPAAALETALWAAAGGDVQQFAERLLFTPDAAKAARQLLESLPEDSRAQTVDLAVMGADGGGKEVTLMLRRERDDAEWKLAVLGAAVERYATALKGKTPAK